MSKQELILIRGIPGSGKSKIAQRIVNTIGANALHLESSMFFSKTDTYRFKSRQIKESHAWCLQITSSKLRQGKTVVVANTFTRLWELEPFLETAKELNIPVIILKAIGASDSDMGVPVSTIKHMTNRWEDIPGERILSPELLAQLI